ncbi:MAG: F0F1 ATP synthase subunit B [Sciscionella sp.]
MRDLAAGTSANPLLPNGTFIVETIIFGIVLLVIWRFVVPPVRKVLAERADRVRQTDEDNAAAKQKLDDAQARLREALREARTESAAIREEARAEGQRILDQMRERAHAESEQVRQRGAQQLAAARAQLIAELRPEVGGFSTELASRVVGAQVSLPQGQQAAAQDAAVAHALREMDDRGKFQ